jgi:hypothetical protein
MIMPEGRAGRVSAEVRPVETEQVSAMLGRRIGEMQTGVNVRIPVSYFSLTTLA